MYIKDSRHAENKGNLEYTLSLIDILGEMEQQLKQ